MTAHAPRSHVVFLPCYTRVRWGKTVWAAQILLLHDPLVLHHVKLMRGTDWPVDSLGAFLLYDTDIGESREHRLIRDLMVDRLMRAGLAGRRVKKATLGAALLPLMNRPFETRRAA
jgi:hypothetical protein